jgi:hypothetical protein
MICLNRRSFAVFLIHKWDPDPVYGTNAFGRMHSAFGIHFQTICIPSVLDAFLFRGSRPLLSENGLVFLAATCPTKPERNLSYRRSSWRKPEALGAALGFHEPRLRRCNSQSFAINSEVGFRTELLFYPISKPASQQPRLDPNPADGERQNTNLSPAELPVPAPSMSRPLDKWKTRRPSSRE